MDVLSGLDFYFFFIFYSLWIGLEWSILYLNQNGKVLMLAIVSDITVVLVSRMFALLDSS